jgi:choline dehydrogenase-like flavoprotein
MYDYCIIGTGPAGLTLANELLISGKKICIIESGSKNISNKNQKLKKIISIGEIKIKDKSRERAWGGTSNTWAGLSAPLDEVDFEKWPIKYSDLERYYEKLENYGFARLEDYNIESFDEIKKSGDFVFPIGKLEEKIFIASDPPLNFGKKFEDLLKKPNVDVFLDSTVVKLNVQHSVLNKVDIINSNGDKSEIKAKKIIICAGGLESTRLLLISKVGNENNQVGKYLMNHPKNNFGILELYKPVKNIPYLFGYLKSGFAKYAGLRISDDLQRKMGIQNCYIRFEPMFPWTDSRGVYATVNLSKRAKTLLNWWKNKQKGVVNLKDWNETGDDNDNVSPKKSLSVFKALFLILFDLKAVFLYTINRLQNKKEISIKKIRLRNFMEMEPSFENKMTLSSELDVYGSPLPIVDINTTELDKKSIIQLHEIFKEDVERKNIGKFIGDLKNASPWPIISDSSHHLGGTIMGTDKNKSVVDINLKVHSVDNLYICSGSVFPSSGCANPTYTICALAIRLAEHLKQN